MNKSFNKRKNNNNKFDKSPENFKINMNNINNLGNYNYAMNETKKEQKEEVKDEPKEEQK